MSRRITVTADVQVPRVPNFLRTGLESTVPLYALTDDDLRKLGEAWTEALIKRAGVMRDQLVSDD